MKNPEEWAVRLYNVGDDKGGIDSEQDLIPFVIMIQNDARADLLTILKKIEEECDDADGSIDATPCEKQSCRILGIIKG